MDDTQMPQNDDTTQDNGMGGAEAAPTPGSDDTQSDDSMGESNA